MVEVSGAGEIWQKMRALYARAAETKFINTSEIAAKIEPQRWYYHCDKLGLVVWQDMVNGGSKYNLWFVTYLTNVLQPLMRRLPDKAPLWELLSRGSESSRAEYRRELEALLEQ